MSGWLEIAPEISSALAAGRPVVALETTVVTHGLPAPAGLETALACEAEVRRGGATPATVGILGGRARVGLGTAGLEELAAAGAEKVNPGNLAAVLARGGAGSTTVAATLLLAARAGIRVLATGGIGGVHRGGGGDVSADLAALARHPAAVVSSGAKAILDLRRTLEALESLGVPVFAFGVDGFPAFYRRDSGLPVDRRFDGVGELAAAVAAHFELAAGGVLVGHPVPRAAELDARTVATAIDRAVAAAGKRGLAGRAVTPFLLAEVERTTGGASVAANRALLASNAALAGRLAVALAAGAGAGGRHDSC